MPDYDLSRLSARSFEQLTQSLAAKIVGPNIVVFGDGPDGGREATFEGTLPYPNRTEPWSGYCVVQAKFRQRPRTVQEDLEWVLQQLRKELIDFLDERLARRKPEYYIFVTNIVLTAVPITGGKARVADLIGSFKEELPFKGYDIWDYDKLRVFLDDNQDIRRAYAAWITAGDVLAHIIESLEPHKPHFDRTLTHFLQEELLADQYANLEKARHASDNPVPIAKVFVDLPALEKHSVEPPFEELESGKLTGGFIKQVLDAARERLDPISIGLTRDDSTILPEPGRFVLIGGPGQGKTTITQFICQLFRASILTEKAETLLEPEVRQSLKVLLSQCNQEGIALPTARRFPIRISLSEFAKWLAFVTNEESSSLLTYVVHMVQQRSGYRITVEDFREWLKSYPWVVIFDGLDEVPASSNRDEILTAIRSFRMEVRESNADMLIIATTRPQGYSQDFSADVFKHYWLTPLSKIRAMHYGGRLVQVRYPNDYDRRHKIMERLQRASVQQTTARLMRSPLQVTIMTTLVDRTGQPPQERWDLFRKYYNVIYEREVERDIPAAAVLREHRHDVDTIHRRVGLLLQVESERKGKTDARLSTRDFAVIVEERLRERGHEDKNLETLQQDIMKAAADRLVFLVGLEANEVGFEIRSLQEFMAAEGIMAGSDANVRGRLREIASLANWRNVLLFAVGKCYAEREDLFDTVYKICLELNEDDHDPVAKANLAGSILALDLLEDMPAHQMPNDARILARTALGLLDLYPNSQHVRLADLYDPLFAGVYSEEILRRLANQDPKRRLGAWSCLLALIESGIDWARAMVDKHWPTDIEQQLDLFEVNRDFAGSDYVVPKSIKILPLSSPSLLVAGQMRSSKNLIPIEGSMPVWTRSVISFLRGPSSRIHGSLMLNGAEQLGRCTVISAFDENDQRVAAAVSRLPNPSKMWAPIVACLSFCATPTRFTLAAAFEGLIDTNLTVWQGRWPWPLEACLASVRAGDSLTEFASMARNGDLGDSLQWRLAERRWRMDGIIAEDVYSATDERWPFDRNIAAEGFPFACSTWAYDNESELLLPRLLALYQQMRDGVMRRTMAGWILSLIGSHTNQLFSREQFRQLVEEANSLGQPIPLRSLDAVNWSDTTTSVSDVDILNVVGDGNIDLDHKGWPDIALRLGLALSDANASAGVIRLAYRAICEGRFGIEVPQHILKRLEAEPSTTRLATAIRLLTLNPENNIKTLALDAIQSLSDDVIEEIVSVLPAGNETNEVLLELREALPSNRFRLIAIINKLLHDSLRKRVSRFTDSNIWDQLGFNYPMHVSP